MKRTLSAFAALLLAAGLVVGIASPAAAAFQDCPNVVSGPDIAGCMWEHSNATGARLHVYEVEGCKNMPWGWSNVVSSVKDHDFDTAGIGRFRVWVNANCSGSSWWISGGSGWAGNLCGFWIGPPNDDIESYAWYPSSS